MVFLWTLLHFHRVTKSGTALLINARSSDLGWESLVSKFRVVEIGIISLWDSLSTSNIHIMKTFIRNLGGLVVQGEWECVRLCVCVVAAWYMRVHSHACVYACVCSFVWYSFSSGSLYFSTKQVLTAKSVFSHRKFSFPSAFLLCLSPLCKQISASCIVHLGNYSFTMIPDFLGRQEEGNDMQVRRGSPAARTAPSAHGVPAPPTEPSDAPW